MTTKKQGVERWLSQLSDIEFENQRLLDDGSLRLIAEVRSRDLLADDEWIQVKDFLKQALTFLSGPQDSVTRKADGSMVVDPDADPRNANWIRISAACRLANHSLPMWAALWLWQLRTDTSQRFWIAVGQVAETLGYPALGHPTLLSEERKPEVILEIGAEGGSITLYGIHDGTKWRYCMSVADSTPLLLPDEFEGSEDRRDSRWVGSWGSALRLMDRYQWHQLQALTVHPEFRERVWTAVQHRFAPDVDPNDHALARWRELCSEKLI